MYRAILPLLTTIIFALAAIWAYRGWKQRIANQAASFDQPKEALDYFGQLLTQTKCFYVATTYAQNELERIAAYGLGVRGIAQILIFEEGALLIRNGENPIAIETGSIASISTASSTIDKGVEKDGLIRIDWMQSGAELATFIRVVDIEARQNLLSNLLSISNRKATIN